MQCAPDSYECCQSIFGLLRALAKCGYIQATFGHAVKSTQISHLRPVCGLTTLIWYGYYSSRVLINSWLGTFTFTCNGVYKVSHMYVCKLGTRAPNADHRDDWRHNDNYRKRLHAKLKLYQSSTVYILTTATIWDTAWKQMPPSQPSPPPLQAGRASVDDYSSGRLCPVWSVSI